MMRTPTLIHLPSKRIARLDPAHRVQYNITLLYDRLHVPAYMLETYPSRRLVLIRPCVFNLWSRMLCNSLRDNGCIPERSIKMLECKTLHSSIFIDLSVCTDACMVLADQRIHYHIHIILIIQPVRIVRVDNPGR